VSIRQPEVAKSTVSYRKPLESLPRPGRFPPTDPGERATVIPSGILVDASHLDALHGMSSPFKYSHAPPRFLERN
jgi:hypothetical protein